jgi:ribosome assembly protein 4
MNGGGGRLERRSNLVRHFKNPTKILGHGKSIIPSLIISGVFLPSYYNMSQPSKKQRTGQNADTVNNKSILASEAEQALINNNTAEPSYNTSDISEVLIQFQSLTGESSGPQLSLPYNATVDQLTILINKLLNNEEKLPYSFYIDNNQTNEEIASTLKETIEQTKLISTEAVLTILYQPQALFRVRAVTRCTATIPGHSEAILSVHFSPDSSQLASGSGDSTVRIWDVLTATPKATLRGHKNWVLAVAWSPNGRCIASAGMDGELRIWNSSTGNLLGKPYKGHRSYINSIAWEPLHLNYNCSRLATASKDNDIKLWDITRRICVLTLSGHSAAVKCIKWGATGLIYSASHDRTIKVWNSSTGQLVRTLEGHAHWVNHLSLSTDYALRTAAYNDKGELAAEDEKGQVEHAKTRINDSLAFTKSELLVSGSDDFTLILWDPCNSKKAIARLTGHQQPVNNVCFSPDGKYIASASFDKSIKLWQGTTGNYITTFRAHVQAVYQVCWSADSRLICSSSKDSTIKVWDVTKKKLQCDLPGHADEVFAVDWSPDGNNVASGGKDQVVKIWKQ